MKRIASIVISAIIMLCACVPAFADMDGPSFTEFDVVVTNSSGTDVYEFRYEVANTIEHLSKDTVVTITGEFEFNDEIYYKLDYNDKEGYIRVADTAIIDKEFAPEDGFKLEEQTSSIVISDGLYMYKGPSKQFEKVGEEIAVGTVLTYQYMNDEYNAPWAYVTYKGVSGWAYVYEYEEAFYCATPFEDDSGYLRDLYIVGKGVRLTNIPFNPEYNEYREEKVDVKYVTEEIPLGTRLEFADYYYKNAKSIWVYAEYNGVNGWIEIDADFNNPTAAGKKSNTYYYVWQAEGVPVYSVAGDTSSQVICTLEKGTFAKGNYFASNYDFVEIFEGSEEHMVVYEDWIGVDVNGKIGWIFNNCTELDDGYTNIYVTLEKTINEDVNLRKETATDSEVIAVIPANSDIIKIGDANKCKLVDYNGTIGYISDEAIVEKSWEEYSEDNYTEDDYFNKIMPEKTSSPETETVQQSTQPETQADDGEKSNSFTPGQIAACCIAGALVIALTAAVTIILINKKKKA